MDRYRKYYMTIGREDFTQAEEILDKFYNRGDLDKVTVEFQGKSETVLIGVECSTDDLLALQKEMRENGIVIK